MNSVVQKYIDDLGLSDHPEGGYYRETYRSGMEFIPPGFDGFRNASTGIYYMLVSGSFSAFHRLKADEMWHFYTGDTLKIYVIYPNGRLEIVKLGTNLDENERPQALIPANCWLAAKVGETGDFGLVGCTMSPGFDFQDFEMASRSSLRDEFPQHKKIIEALTRK